MIFLFDSYNSETKSRARLGGSVGRIQSTGHQLIFTAIEYGKLAD